MRILFSLFIGGPAFILTRHWVFGSPADIQMICFSWIPLAVYCLVLGAKLEYEENNL